MKRRNIPAIVLSSFLFFCSSLMTACVVPQPPNSPIPPGGSPSAVTPLDINDLPIHIAPPRRQTVDDPPTTIPGPPQVIVTGVDPTTGIPTTTTIPGPPITVGGGSSSYLRYPITNVSNEDVIKAQGIFFDFDKNGNLVRTFPWEIVRKNRRIRAHQSIYPAGGFPRRGHRWVVAVLNVETDTGVWTVDVKDARQAATDIVTGKTPVLPKPAYKKK